MRTARPPRFVWLLLSWITLVGVANAQDAGQAGDTLKAGVTMGYPASIGLIVRVTNTVALRPELSFSGSTTRFSPTPEIRSATTEDGSTIGVGVSALFYAGRWENLRTYISPRWSYSHASSTISSSSFAILDIPVRNGGSTTTTVATNSVTGSLGAEYSLGRRFAVFGETGFGYSRQTSSTTVILFPSENRSHGWGSRSGIGVILRF